MQTSICPTYEMLKGIPEEELPTDLADFWRTVAYELRELIVEALRAQEPQIVLSPYRKAGTQYIWEFFVNDLSVPRGNSMNWHGQNTSQWKYAGCILLQAGRVSSHH